MENYVILEKLYEIIGDRQVIAAVFYTFNFDACFFENHILPKFVQNVPFSDNELQNNILWRKYGSDLPPVTVYCDFNAKVKEAPTLGYTVREIDLKTIGHRKPCFHPKNSFILLEDWSLIVVTGSPNLSVAGWCKNIEGVSIFELKKGKVFPYHLKHQIKDFVSRANDLHHNKPSNAEKILDRFFSQRQHTEECHLRFFGSLYTDMYQETSKLLERNHYIPFKRIEILSPYFSPDADLVAGTVKLSSDGKVYALIPYNATNTAGVTKEIYRKFEEVGICWSRLTKGDEDKMFRFNHSKIYRFKGETEMYTIVGSNNFTEAGWASYKNQGNIETSVIYTEPITNWQDWLVEYSNPEIQFVTSMEAEEQADQRFDKPDLDFTLDWLDKKLIYNHPETSKFKGLIMLPGRNHEIIYGNDITISLEANDLAMFAENSIIKVHEYGTQRDFYFFPVVLNNESRPCSNKLKLNDYELLELWKKVKTIRQSQNEIMSLLEKFFNIRIDAEGELIKQQFRSKSTLNLMASHIHALISLEDRLFEIPGLVRDYRNASMLLEYYLFTDNIDTLKGYRNLLSDMYKEKSMLPGVMWFLLNLLMTDFYDTQKVLKALSRLRSETAGVKDKLEITRKEISAEMKSARKNIQSPKISDRHFKWITDQIREK